MITFAVQGHSSPASTVETLRTAAHNGYTISRGEIFVGAVAVAAPYFDHRGIVAGSVGVYGPAARVSEEKIVEFARQVRQLGHKISALLGSQALAVESTAKTADIAPIKRIRRVTKA
jgi:DNA-binding IclR family transcriptional regulator